MRPTTMVVKAANRWRPFRPRLWAQLSSSAPAALDTSPWDLMMAEAATAAGMAASAGSFSMGCPNFLMVTLGTEENRKAPLTTNIMEQLLAKVDTATIFHCRDCIDFEVSKASGTTKAEQPLDLAELAAHLLDCHGVVPGSLGGVVIRTVPDRYLIRGPGDTWCPQEPLDLRREPSPSTPNASQILQSLDEQSLLRIFRCYSSLKAFAKPVASAIMEARFMFHKFSTAEELSRVLSMAASNICATRNALAPHRSDDNQEELMLDFLMKETLTALGYFVNDDLNKLDFAIRSLAFGFLKPDQGGLLLTSIHSDQERKVVDIALKESRCSPLPSDSGRYWQPWRVLKADPLLPNSKPRLQMASPSYMFIASRRPFNAT